MRNAHVVAAVSAVVAAGIATFAPSKAAAQGAPHPAPEIAQLKPFEGRWSCSGQMNASPFGPAHPTITSVMAHSDLGGFWVSGRVVESKTAESPMPIEGMFHQTWDPGAKHFLMLWVDNMGGWSQETSPGWQDGTIVWTGEAYGDGQKMGTRDSFTQKGAGELLHTMALNTGGRWVTLGEETCTLVPRPAGPRSQ